MLGDHKCTQPPSMFLCAPLQITQHAPARHGRLLKSTECPDCHVLGANMKDQFAKKMRQYSSSGQRPFATGGNPAFGCKKLPNNNCLLLDGRMDGAAVVCGLVVNRPHRNKHQNFAMLPLHGFEDYFVKRGALLPVFAFVAIVFVFSCLLMFPS